MSATLTLDQPSPPSRPLYAFEVAELDQEITDAEAGFVRGDDGALKCAYDAHGALIYTLCRRSLPEDRAADVTQEVFVSAWRAHGTFDPQKGRLAAWLTGIAKNRIIDNIRSEQRHSSRRSDAPVVDLTAESEIDRTADKMLVAQVLTSLPDRQRQMVKLAYLDGFTHTEIADKTNRPLGTVKSDIRRGLDRIRRDLGGDR
jgi:RNA polymerase sigma factor (sigma-70 family)